MDIPVDAAAVGVGSRAAEYGGVPQQSALVLFVMAVPCACF